MDNENYCVQECPVPGCKKICRINTDNLEDKDVCCHFSSYDKQRDAIIFVAYKPD